jgi:hypothetical protein
MFVYSCGLQPASIISFSGNIIYMMIIIKVSVTTPLCCSHIDLVCSRALFNNRIYIFSRSHYPLSSTVNDFYLLLLTSCLCFFILICNISRSVQAPEFIFLQKWMRHSSEKGAWKVH